MKAISHCVCTAKYQKWKENLLGKKMQPILQFVVVVLIFVDTECNIG